MRYTATVIEGDEQRTCLVPLSTLLAFPERHDGKSMNDMITAEDVAPEAWEPWVVWHAHTKRGVPKEEADFEAWCERIDWWKVASDEEPADPSGGEATPMPVSSPGSSSAPTAGLRSSTSTTSSSTPSGPSSAPPEL